MLHRRDRDTWSLFRAMLALTFVSGLVGASPLVAMAGVLGEEGTIFKLESGIYGDFFPEGVEADAQSGVLVLDVMHADGSSERFLVPETENFSGESSANLVYEKETGVAYLLWEGLQNGLHPKLYLTSFDHGLWSSVIEITGSPFARKSHPQLVVTREAITGGGDRLVMHVAWSEESAGGNRKRYAPIVIENAERLPWPRVWDLTGFLAGEEGPFVDLGNEALSLVPGTSDDAVVVAWLTESGDRVASAEIALVPRALEELADEARAQIINGGARARGKNHAVLAAEIYQLILSYGGDFHEAGLHYIAELVYRIVLTFPEPISTETVPGLGDKARAQIINGGLRLKTGGLRGPADFEVIAVPRPDVESAHLFKLRLLSERPTPEIGADPALYVTPRSGDVIIAWDDEEQVHYVESRGEGWSEPRAITLSGDLDRGTVHEMLAARARDR